MNQESVNLADLLNGEYGKATVIADRVYFIKSPTIKTIAKAVSFFGKVNLSEDIKSMQENRKHIVSGVAAVIAAGKSKTEENRIRRELMNGTDEEIRDAMSKILKMIACEDFFMCAGIAMEIAKMVAVPAEKQ